MPYPRVPATSDRPPEQALGSLATVHLWSVGGQMSWAPGEAPDTGHTGWVSGSGRDWHGPMLRNHQSGNEDLRLGKNGQASAMIG